MKIWIDITNSPHVLFFQNIINDLKTHHEILITTRPLANTIELLEQVGFSYNIIGKHYGQKSLNKIFGFFIRIFQLTKFLKSKKIDVSISHSSFYSPIVSKILKARCVYLNDNEHAQGNRISFVFSDHIMVPEYLNLEKVKKQGAKSEKIIVYPGVKEGVYLWSLKLDHKSKISPDKKRQTIYIRPEPWTAQYYKGRCNFIDNLLINLKSDYSIVLLPRGKLQSSYYRSNKFSGITIPKSSKNLKDIMQDCDLFIGAGGTMTREAAVLGIPTISIYQDHLLDVDRYLIDIGLMIHRNDLSANEVRQYLSLNNKQKPNRYLLHKGKATHAMIKDVLLNQTVTARG